MSVYRRLEDGVMAPASAAELDEVVSAYARLVEAGRSGDQIRLNDAKREIDRLTRDLFVEREFLDRIVAAVRAEKELN